MVICFHIKYLSGNVLSVYCRDKSGQRKLHALQSRRLGVNIGLSGSSKLSIPTIQISLAIHNMQIKTFQSTKGRSIYK